MFLIVHTTHKILNNLERVQKLTHGVFDALEPMTYLDESKNAQAAIKVPLSSINEVKGVLNVFANVGNRGHLLVTGSGVALEHLKGDSVPNIKGFWHKVADRKMLDGAVHYFDGESIFRIEGGLYA
jgi:hypothetical protein